MAGNLNPSFDTSTTGGKGNRGRFVERDKRICAAGDPTAQANLNITDAFQQYLLKDEVDALVSDSIIPLAPPRPLAPMREPPPPDMRHGGLTSELGKLVNPPNETKFQSLVSDLKETVYKSYWSAPLGRVPDPVPSFPQGFDMHNRTYGRSTVSGDRLYDVVMPKVPIPDKTPPTKRAGAQVDRKYCRPAFNPDLIYGYRSYLDQRGILVKCVLTDDKVVNGTDTRNVLTSIESNLRERVTPRLGLGLAPNDNVSLFPEGFSFGIMTADSENLAELLTTCKLNPKREDFLKCLAHLNTIRKNMATRFLPSFFKKAYLDLKYYDTAKTGWIPKERVYDYCLAKMIRFDPKLIEPLLACWDAFDGANIKHSTFVQIFNFKLPLPDLPKVEDVDPECLDFRTTYSEMMKPGQPVDERWRAGEPSGRYLDLDYPITPNFFTLADRISLPHETDTICCISPSILTQMTVTHRDMFAARDKATVRRVFEAAGDTFTEESFNEIWEEAQKHHSLGWVCYETFRKAQEKLHPTFPE